jgi:adenosylmethionine-8-amino-7-oxononanoate aminotransferase
MSILLKDKRFVWHPYTQDKTAAPAVPVVKGKGAWLYDAKGKKYFDAISSWWVNLHGHSHPYIAKKVSNQLKKLEHVIFAGFTHEPAVTLAEKLLGHLPPGHSKIFYSDNGSTAVEAALKMAFQYWYNKGKPRKKVIAFRNAYHGDTFGAMSVSGRSAFTAPYKKFLFEVIYVEAPVPGKEEKAVRSFSSVIGNNADGVAAFIFEPLVQGVAGMVMHDAVALSTMIRLCRKHNILTIADEVMTGFGRTGKFFASDHLRVSPDIVCLSKGLTGGTMALGVTSCKEKIHRAFISDNPLKTFFHGHSYTANPTACTAALASLDLLKKKQTQVFIKKITESHTNFVKEISRHPGIKEARSIGTILAIELKSEEKSSYFDPIRKKISPWFLKRGILIRPLGNVIYLMPPYCTTVKDLERIYKMIRLFLDELR